jgi:predicted RNase H-like nuclease (RuvC/YqgF family)
MNVINSRFHEKSKMLKNAQYRISSLEMELDQCQKLFSLNKEKFNLEVKALEEKCRRLLLLLEEQTTLRTRCEEKLETVSAGLIVTSSQSLQLEVGFFLVSLMVLLFLS